jgi:chromate transporter
MSETATAPPRPPTLAPTLGSLLIAFSIVAVSGFGGVLYWSRRMLVEKRKWMTEDEFNEAYALCNFLPGPNIVNLAVVFGRRIAGTKGALVALVGLLGPPVVIVTFFGFLYGHYGDTAVLQRMFAGVAAAAAGLTISTSIKMMEPVLRQRIGVPHAVAAATFAAVGLLRWPLHWVLAVTIPLSIALAWWVRR